MNQFNLSTFKIKFLQSVDILVSNQQAKSYAMEITLKKAFIFETFAQLDYASVLDLIIIFFNHSIWTAHEKDFDSINYGNINDLDYFTLYFFQQQSSQLRNPIANLVFHIDSREQKIFSLRDYSLSAKYLKNKRPTLITFVQQFFHVLLEYLLTWNSNFIVDSVPDSQDPDALTSQQFFKDNILAKSYILHPTIYHNKQFVFQQISTHYPTFYQMSFNEIKIDFRNRAILSVDSSQTTQTPSQQSSSLMNFISQESTPTPTNTPIPHINIILYSDPFEYLPPGTIKETALSLMNKYQPRDTAQHPSLSSDIRSRTNTRISNTDFSTINNTDEWQRYLKVVPKYIEDQITKTIAGKNNLKDWVKLAEPTFQKYQKTIHDREGKQLDKLKSYLTTPSSPNLDIKQDKKGLVYSIIIPNNIPDNFISKAGKLTIPNGYHSLSFTDKINELNTLQTRMQNFHEIIHHDLLMIANNPFLGKIYSPTNDTKTYTAEEILQICLNTATHPDEWQLTGRKILALTLQNPLAVSSLLRNATAGSISKIDYRFSDDLINKLYCTTVNNIRLRIMLTDHVGSSLSSTLGKRVTGSLILVWLYAPLLTDHPSESSIKERAGFLTYLYPPASLKDFLKDIRKYDISEVELLPATDEYSLKYRFPLQKFKRELSSSSFEITSIWQNIRGLLCGLAYLSDPATFQTKITNKTTDLYIDIYYSAFKILQEKIVAELPKDTTIPCSLSSLLMFSSDNPIMFKIWAQWVQFFMVLIANKNQFIKPQTLEDMLKNLYTNYPRIRHGTILRPTQVLPQPQPLPPPTSPSNNSVANDDDTLDAIAFGLTEVEDSPSATTTTNNSSPLIVYEWKPTLRGIINYNKKRTVLNFGTNEAYSDPHAFMSMFFVNPLNDVWRMYTYQTQNYRDNTRTTLKSELLYFDLIENNISNISDQAQLESLKQAFQQGQPLTFPPLSDTEKQFNFSPLTLSPNDLSGVVLKLPKTPTPHTDTDWQFTYFQLAGVNPLYVLLSECQSDKQFYHRDFNFPMLRWSRSSKNGLPTFHFSQEYTTYTNITLDEQITSISTPSATKSTKKLQLQPTEIAVPFKYLVSLDQGVRNPLSFKIRKLPKTIDTQTLDFTTLDGALRKESVRETLGSGFIGHATPKGSTVSEPALLTAIDGIITKISSDEIDVLSRGIIEDQSSTPQATDTNAASVVSFDIAASTQNLDHGKIKYTNVSQSLPQSQILPQLTGFKLKNVVKSKNIITSPHVKPDNSKDNPKSKPEAWLYHLIRIQARLDDRYIDICSKQQILALLMDLYKFINPTHQKLSWLKRSFIRSKVKEYRTIHKDDTFLQQFSVTKLVKWIKSNAISNFRDEISRLWVRERFARVEFTRLLIKLFKHEVFESGILPPNTKSSDILLGLEDLRSYQSKKIRKKKFATPDPFWTALEKDFQTSTGDPKKDFFRSLWLEKAQELDNSKATSRKNSLWSHGLLRSYFEGFFTKNNIVYINPYKTSLQCMYCGKEGKREGEVFTCTNTYCEKYNTPMNADSNSNPNIEVRSLYKYLEKLINNATQTSSDLENT